MAKKFRFEVEGNARGPWRDTKKAALEDAMGSGYAFPSSDYVNVVLDATAKIAEYETEPEDLHTVLLRARGPLSFAELGVRGMDQRMEEVLVALIGDATNNQQGRFTVAEMNALGYGTACQCGERGLKPGEKECTECRDEDERTALSDALHEMFGVPPVITGTCDMCGTPGPIRRSLYDLCPGCEVKLRHQHTAFTGKYGESKFTPEIRTFKTPEAAVSYIIERIWWGAAKDK